MRRLAFKIAYIRQVSVLLVVVQPVTYYTKVFNLKADIVSLHIHKSSGWLVEKCADFNALRISVRQMLFEELKCGSGINNILNDDHVFAVNVAIKVFFNLYHA